MSKLQPVSITSLSAPDLEEMGFDTSKITQDELEDLATRMSDVYVEHYYWDALSDLAAIMELPRH